MAFGGRHVAVVWISCLATACIPARKDVAIEGRVVFPEGLAPPPGYAVEIAELRRSPFLSRREPVALLVLADDGSFAFRGALCRDFHVEAVWVDAVALSTDEEEWREAILFEATVEQAELIKSQTWPLPDLVWAQERIAVLAETPLSEQPC